MSYSFHGPWFGCRIYSWSEHKFQAPRVVSSSLLLLLTSRSIRSHWHIQFTFFRYVHEISHTHTYKPNKRTALYISIITVFWLESGRKDSETNKLSLYAALPVSMNPNTKEMFEYLCFVDRAS